MKNQEERRITLIDSLREDWFKLPSDIMRSSGPATQAFAGLLKVMDFKTKETFAAASKIADKSQLPLRTFNRQLERLRRDDWILNRGREAADGQMTRRTCTIELTKYAKQAMTTWYPLPVWACHDISGLGPFPWCAKAVFAVVMGKLMKLAAAAQRDEELGEVELLGQLSNWGYEERFRYSLPALADASGLSEKSAYEGKYWLSRNKIIRLQGDRGGADCLIPRDDFYIIENFHSKKVPWLRVER